MIRKIYKASGQTSANGTTGTTGTTGTSSNAAQVGGSVANTAIKEGTSLAAGILSGGATYLIDAITGIFTGAFNLVGTLGTTRNNNAAQTQQLYWYTSKDRNEERETNNGFYVIVGLGIMALVVYLIVKSHKSK